MLIASPHITSLHPSQTTSNYLHTFVVRIKQCIWKQPEQGCTDLSEPHSTAERPSNMKGPYSHTFVHRLAGCRPFPPLHQQTLNHQLRVNSLNYWNSELLKYYLPWWHSPSPSGSIVHFYLPPGLAHPCTRRLMTSGRESAYLFVNLRDLQHRP